MSDYLPREYGAHGPGCQTSLSWFERLPDYIGRSSLLDDALGALSLAFAGQRHQNPEWIRESERGYSMVVAKLYRLGGTRDAAQVADVIGAALVLAIYQLYNCGTNQPQAWMIHIQAAWRLLEEQGPHMPIDRHLLRRVRTLALYDACGRRKSTFLATPRWRATAPREGEYDKLLDILLELPSIQELLDETRLFGHTPDRFESIKQRFIRLFNETETQFRVWYLSLLNNLAECPFSIRTATWDDLCLLHGSPDLMNVFPEVLEFPDRYTLQLLLLAWLGFLILHHEMSPIMQMLSITLERPHILLPRGPHGRRQWLNDECALVAGNKKLTSTGESRTFHDIERVADKFAERLCQALALCDKSTHGSAMRQPVLPTFWAANQFFRERDSRKFAWCQTVLRNFTSRGIRYGTELATLSYQRYSEIGERLRLKSGYVRTESESP
ncbi:uncharacterized protein N7482_003354 [Penicillium canariense]|uniref:Uncharacterized protein n=1 Tax=Penicillium canariense TaxID=189055 RepID=A0A9W9I4F1_9EURO|nr:uncharacterized protein N7482_003354 [Penicillium canariense]KAJ5167760.1 hypothetical protein N7482_003354 [Penicillium canariense]